MSFRNNNDNTPGTPFGGRVRLPRPGEVLGVVTQLVGGARMHVQCVDGKDRMCRVPGKIKRRIWVKDGDYVIVKPWDVEPDTKGDIAFRYTRLQVDHLRSRGLLKLDL